jgi:hypothetical protein
VDVPVANPAENALFTIQAGKDLLAALQAQEQPGQTTVSFNQLLEATRSVTDTVEVGAVAQAATPDPTSSTLFQALSGSLVGSPVAADFPPASKAPSQAAILGIDASTAAGPFLNGQSLPSEEFQTGLSGLNPAASSRFPAVSGVGEFTSTYDALRSAGRMNPPIGTRLDVQG